MGSSWMVIDGKLNPGALPALYAPGMASDVVALLQGTAYTAIAASGPLLARLENDSSLQARWKSNEHPVRHAWCFTSELTPYQLAAHWRRRLLWRGPMGRTLWLRYSDARVISRGIEHAVFPDGFWHAVESVKLSPQQAAWSPLRGSSQNGWQETDSVMLTPLFALDERQLAALSTTLVTDVESAS